MRRNQSVGVVIPALNEECAIGRVISDIPGWVDHIIVVDNGSSDQTTMVAERAGARVARENERGYGSACQTGIDQLPDTDILVFLDGDYSDHPDEMARLVDPIVSRDADFVIGSRVRGELKSGALTPQQQLGNWLACRLIYLIWGVRFTDLGPFRAIRRGALKALAMSDRDYGWTVEMQIRATQKDLRTLEVPVSYRPRIGVSKVSGTVKGSLLAGTKILTVIARSAVKSRVS